MTVMTCIKRVIPNVKMTLIHKVNVRTITTGHKVLGVGSHMSDNDPEVLEKSKQRAMKKAKSSNQSGAYEDEWDESAASESEAMVKADRMPNLDDPSQMQKETLKHQRERVAVNSKNN
ncbi:hypothetical protein MIR68_010177 [Amoeboaphelidium protococcarum]|nr:hypothetical protein MIR68_010177 [Amoeboaphelidium protococcarum]